MDGSPAGTIYRREDGLVIIDPEKAKGHPEIVDTCPYGAIYWNEEQQVAQKCTGCAHLVDAGWTETRCSQVCPTNAIQLVLADDAEWAQLWSQKEGLRGLPGRARHQARGSCTRTCTSGTRSSPPAAWRTRTPTSAPTGAKVTVSADGRRGGRGRWSTTTASSWSTGWSRARATTVTIEAAGYKAVHEDRHSRARASTSGLVMLEKA